MSYIKDVAVPVIALCSLILNVYMAFLLRRRSPHISGIGQLRETLRAFINSCEGSRVLTVEPHYELWEMGFQSLAEIRKAVVECCERFTFDKNVPIDIKTIVARLRAEVEDLYKFRDSFTRFSKGKRFTSDAAIAKWRDLERAKHALSVLQTDFRSKKDELKAFLAKLDSY